MMYRRLASILCALIIPVLPLHASADRVKFLEGASTAATLSPAELEEPVTGYLPSGAPELVTAVSPPPGLDSEQDKADVALFRDINAAASTARWEIAVADDASVYDRFAEALSIPPDRAHLPALVRLLNRVSEDVLAVTGEAKKRFARPRPMQRFALRRVCGYASPPKPEVSPSRGSSYPSGHASVSWAAALVMMEVAPARAQHLIGRAVSFGNSRIVCGLHFPADIEAGHFIGAGIVGRLFSDPVFRRDLLCAKREFNAVLAGEKSEDLPACQF